MTIPDPAAEQRRKKAERQKRWRANHKRREQAAAIVDHVMGVDDGAPAPPRPDLPPGDLALLLRDRFHKVINGLSDEQLLSKDFAPALSLGLKAQKVMDDREKVKAKEGRSLELLGALFAILNPGEPAPVRLIGDGMTLEGEFSEQRDAPLGSPVGVPGERGDDGD